MVPLFSTLTSAQVCVLLASPVDKRLGEVGPPLEAANQGKIRTYGKRLIPLCFNGQSFTWEFVLADVSRPLLGADFLCTNGLLVDVKNLSNYCRRLKCFTLFKEHLSHGSSVQHIDRGVRVTWFPNLTKPTFSSAVVSHGVIHHISTSGPPVYAWAR